MAGVSKVRQAGQMLIQNRARRQGRWMEGLPEGQWSEMRPTYIG